MKNSKLVVVVVVVFFLMAIGSVLPTSRKKEAEEQRLASVRREIAVSHGQEREKRKALNPLYGLERPTSNVWLEGDSLSFEDFKSAIESFSPIDAMGEFTTYSEGYSKTFLKYKNAFYYIPLEIGLDPRYIFCLGLWTSGYGSNELACVENDIFGLYEPQESIPQSIRKFCSLLKEDEQYIPETEVLKLIYEVFPE